MYGKFSDTFGRKPCLLFSYTVFLLGVLMCGFAQSMQWFIAARVSKLIKCTRTSLADYLNRFFRALVVVV